MIDRTGMSNAEVLQRLYNAANQIGLGLFDQDGKEALTIKQAQGLLNLRRTGGTYFDYLNGRVMKIDVGENPLDPRFYDRDNGNGVARDAITGVGWP